MAKSDKFPKHIAIIMDGNGRWARRQGFPRIAGHRAGLNTLQKIIKACSERGIKFLTLFAFSSENWQRPVEEVSHLMELFLTVLKKEIKKLHESNVRIKVIGDRSRFNDLLIRWIDHAERLTNNNSGLYIAIAINYGGQWDIANATQIIAKAVENKKLSAEAVTPELINNYLSTSDFPDPDLFIRTSGEQRISNFLLWQLAYTELYFTETLWPDFDEKELDKAIEFFASRERRFGGVNEQIGKGSLMVKNV